jgi:hypothetical protein
MNQGICNHPTCCSIQCGAQIAATNEQYITYNYIVLLEISAHEKEQLHLHKNRDEYINDALYLELIVA